MLSGFVLLWGGTFHPSLDTVLLFFVCLFVLRRGQDRREGGSSPISHPSLCIPTQHVRLWALQCSGFAWSHCSDAAVELQKLVAFFLGLINISIAAAARTNLPEPLCVWLTLVFPLPIISAAAFSLKLPLRGFAQRSERQSCFLLPF